MYIPRRKDLKYFKIDDNKLDLQKKFPAGMTMKRALELAIAKWWLIALSTTAITEGTEGKTCALCVRSIEEGLIRWCRNCVISRRTGAPSCLNTPYSRYRANPCSFNAMVEVHYLQDLYEKEFENDGGCCDVVVPAADEVRWVDLASRE